MGLRNTHELTSSAIAIPPNIGMSLLDGGGLEVTPELLRQRWARDKNSRKYDPAGGTGYVAPSKEAQEAARVFRYISLECFAAAAILPLFGVGTAALGTGGGDGDVWPDQFPLFIREPVSDHDDLLVAVGRLYPLDRPAGKSDSGRGSRRVH